MLPDVVFLVNKDHQRWRPFLIIVRFVTTPTTSPPSNWSLVLCFLSKFSCKKFRLSLGCHPGCMVSSEVVATPPPIAPSPQWRHCSFSTVLDTTSPLTCDCTYCPDISFSLSSLWPPMRTQWKPLCLDTVPSKLERRPRCLLVTTRNSTRRCRVLGNEPDLKTVVQNLGHFP